MKTRTYVRPEDIDKTTIKQCKTVTSFKLNRISGALAALGFESGLNLAMLSMMYGGAATLMGMATKEKNTPAKVVLGGSGALLTLATTYVCSESVDNALSSFRTRIENADRLIKEYGTPDGYIYFYETSTKQNENPKRPILMKTRVEYLSKAQALLSIAISNMDARLAKKRLDAVKESMEKAEDDKSAAGTTEPEIKDEALLCLNLVKSLNSIDSSDAYELWDAMYKKSAAAQRKFEERHGMTPGAWLQENDEEFQHISEKATELCHLMYKDKARLVSESTILLRRWQAFKADYKLDPSDWATFAKLPVLDENDPEKVVYFMQESFDHQIDREAAAICKGETVEGMTIEERSNLFIRAYRVTADEWVKARNVSLEEAKPESEAHEEEDDATPKQESDDLNETDE